MTHTQSTFMTAAERIAQLETDLRAKTAEASMYEAFCESHMKARRACWSCRFRWWVQGRKTAFRMWLLGIRRKHGEARA